MYEFLNDKLELYKTLGHISFCATSKHVLEIEYKDVALLTYQLNEVLNIMDKLCLTPDKYTSTLKMLKIIRIEARKECIRKWAEIFPELAIREESDIVKETSGNKLNNTEYVAKILVSNIPVDEMSEVQAAILFLHLKEIPGIHKELNRYEKTTAITNFRTLAHTITAKWDEMLFEGRKIVKKMNEVSKSTPRKNDCISRFFNTLKSAWNYYNSAKEGNTNSVEDGTKFKSN